MSDSVRHLLVETIRDPAHAKLFTPAQWDILIRQARSARLLARLDYLLQKAEVAPPEEVRWQFASATTFAESQKRSVRWEIANFQRFFNKTQQPSVLLKGAAYVARNLDVSRGRVFNDIDLLVPKSALERVEERLKWQGWMPAQMDAYDQRYYRQWMHELPPFKHVKRKTTLDLHHAILPETARVRPKTSDLMADMQPVGGGGYLHVLSPVDMVLHSMTHLFHDGELEHGLRDLADLDALIKQFSAEHTDFWDEFLPRAKVLNLGRSAYYGLRYANSVLQTPVPAKILKDSEQFAPPMPGVMDGLFKRALLPDHKSCDDALTGVARWLLYVRSHYLRMPLRLLLPHLVRKAWVARVGSEAAKV